MLLGKLLTQHMSANKITTRALEKEIGISKSTVSRIARGENVDGRTLIKIIVWLTGPDEEQ